MKKNAELKKLTGFDHWPLTAAETKALKVAHGRQMAAVAETVVASPELQAVQDEVGAEIALAKQLHSIRQRAGLTQKDVAARMGSSQSRVAAIESGRVNATVGSILRYASACGQHVQLRIVPERRQAVHS